MDMDAQFHMHRKPGHIQDPEILVRLCPSFSGRAFSVAPFPELSDDIRSVSKHGYQWYAYHATRNESTGTPPSTVSAKKNDCVLLNFSRSMHKLHNTGLSLA